MQYIRTLSAIRKEDGEAVGRRAVDLAVLQQKDYRVPLSFVLTNAAFENFIVSNALQDRIASLITASGDSRRRYDAIRELFLQGSAPDDLVAEIVEAYESLSIDQEASVNDLVTTKEAPFVTVIISPDHHVPSDSNEGIILNVRGLEQLLVAIKECWACLFTPTLQQHRAAASISAHSLNVGIIVQQQIPGEVSAETWSATGGDKELLTVKTYFGAPDIAGSIEKDECRITREYLKPVFQSVASQTTLLLRDEHDRLGKQPIGARGNEQKLNDREIIEIGRLTKKASTLLEHHVRLIFTVHKSATHLLLSNELLLTKGSVKLQGYVEEERIGESPAASDAVQEGSLPKDGRPTHQVVESPTVETTPSEALVETAPEPEETKEDAPEEQEPSAPEPAEEGTESIFNTDEATVEPESIFSGVRTLEQAHKQIAAALRDAYERRFRNTPPDNVNDIFFELSAEVTLPHEGKIGKLLRIVADDEDYDQELEEQLLACVDDFLGGLKDV